MHTGATPETHELADKKQTDRFVNIVNLAVCAGVLGTGLILFFQFHVGHGAGRDMFLHTHKTVWVNIHRCAALLFLTGLALHISQHWKYIRNVAGRFKKLGRRIRTTSLQQVLLFTAAVVVMAAGFTAWIALSGTEFSGTEYRHRWIDVHNISGLLLLAGLAVHIKRRWTKMFHRRKIGKRVTAPADVPRIGLIAALRHSSPGDHHATEHVRVNTHKCTACGSCVTACPSEVLVILDIIRLHTHVYVHRADQCLGCLKCVTACPNGAFAPVRTPASAM